MGTSRPRESTRWITIVSALPEEVRPFVRNHALERVSAGSERWRGEALGRLVEVACTGMGLLNARGGISELVASAPARAFVFVGTAGALSLALRPGDLVVAERVVLDGESRDNGACDAAAVISVPESPWLDRAAALPGARLGTLVSSRRVASTAIRKRELAERHRLGQAPSAVDMESWEWASAAREAGIPFVIVRAVTDTASEDLPLDFNQTLRTDGSLSKVRVVGSALRRPAALPGLLSLQGRLRLCAERLEQVLVSILA